MEAETENTNRTVKDLRNLFTDHGGNLGKDGSVAYLFEQKGRFEISAEAIDEMTLFEIVVEAGAEEVDEVEETYVVTSARETFADVGNALDEAGIDVHAADLVRSPTTTVSLDPDARDEVQALVEKINDLRDVAAVYTTLELDGAPLMLGTDVEPPTA